MLRTTRTITVDVLQNDWLDEKSINLSRFVRKALAKEMELNPLESKRECDN